MPRENRKRGRRHKKTPAEDTEIAKEGVISNEQYNEQEAGPSWIVGKSTYGEERTTVDLDAPFGYVDPDLKAYFRTVDEKLKEWQEMGGFGSGEFDDESSPIEEKRAFIEAALSEMSGKELQLATDPDCSNILERMSYSMDDFVRRVFMDRLAGSYEQLAKHRFGSHVVQTLLMVARATLEHEMNGVYPKTKDDADSGTLPLISSIILNASEELLENFTALCMDPFASHVLRALFVVLSPQIPSAADESAAILRSRKSAKHRSKQGPMKSVFKDEGAGNIGEKGKKKLIVPANPRFDEMSRRFVERMRIGLGANEVRALAADKAAAPLLALMLEMEHAHESSAEEGSLLDSISAGLVSKAMSSTSNGQDIEVSDYVITLLREPTASHVMEKLVILAPQAAFESLWTLYFKENLGKLAVHPVGNFIVARAIARLNEAPLREALEDMESMWPKLVKNARTGVIKACVENAAVTASCEDIVLKHIRKAFASDETDSLTIIECILYLNSEASGGETRLEPTVQGSLLLQSLLTLHEPHNLTIADAIMNLPIQKLIALSHNPISSRIFDAFLQSPTIPLRYRRKLVLTFKDHFAELVDDRVGSRVGERLWDAADPYLKEKVATTLIPHEAKLVGSRYGKFFMRGLNLYLLRKNPEEWKVQQSKTREASKLHSETAVGDVTAKEEPQSKSEKKKRKHAPQDEIDALFSATEKKRKKSKDASAITTEKQAEVDILSIHLPKTTPSLTEDQDLDGVLNAIRNAPKDTKSQKKTKKAKS